ncbi:hypothetical protein CYY_004366 [Polysphondylium violaceum]|uniref:Peptidase M48 domain-containing protein n=1 Tax=Polysphondylium violaceum TaxID=133409 RepID=A0A8J4PWD0_9MYCE|nr:hypothetical protein CYY_004366 [Polysphondylium violaceum]
MFLRSNPSSILNPQRGRIYISLFEKLKHHSCTLNRLQYTSINNNNSNNVRPSEATFICTGGGANGGFCWCKKTSIDTPPRTILNKNHLLNNLGSNSNNTYNNNNNTQDDNYQQQQQHQQQYQYYYNNKDYEFFSREECKARYRMNKHHHCKVRAMAHRLLPIYFSYNANERKNHFGDCLFYYSSSVPNKQNKSNKSKNTTTATPTTATQGSNTIDKVNQHFQNNLANQHNSSFTNGNRSFHSSSSNQFFYSKAARILLPIALTGFRTWIFKGTLLFRIGVICSLLASVTGGYVLLNQEPAPITGRSRVVTFSEAEEKELGKMGYDEIIETYSDFILPDNNNLQNSVKKIAKKLIDATNRQDLDWDCHVINSENVNAFVLPNGKIFVFSGLFQLCDTEDELAAVIGHEIGHAIARHAAERLSVSKVGYLFLTLTRGLVGDTITGNLTTMLSTSLLGLKYSRIQEMEADIIGLEFMTKANYDPNAAIKVQKRFAQMEVENGRSENSIVNLFATHPIGNERIENIEKWVSEYEKSNTSSVSLNHKPQMLVGTKNPLKEEDNYAQSAPNL